MLRCLLRCTCWAAALMLSAAPVAAKVLTVEGVVSPAWVERGDKKEPLRIGMQLAGKDRVVTGPNARVMLSMSEGSAVKLGENTTLSVESIAEKKNAAGNQVVSASLDVVKGAFRFTTGVFGKPRAEREVDVKVSTVTAGIRGTDVWGRSTTADDLVCLLEGKISVTHGGKSLTMDQPLQFFIAPRNAPPKPIGFVEKKQIDEWSRETEITEGLGATRSGGRTRLELLRTPDQNAAQQLQVKLANWGFPALLETIAGSYGAPGEYVVYIGGIANDKESGVLKARIGNWLAGKPEETTAPGAPKKY